MYIVVEWMFTTWCATVSSDSIVSSSTTSSRNVVTISSASVSGSNRKLIRNRLSEVSALSQTKI